MSGAPSSAPLPPRRVNTFTAVGRRKSPAPRPSLPPVPIARVARPVLALERTELDGSGRMGAHGVFVTPETLVTDSRLAVSVKTGQRIPWLRVRIGELELAATVTGYSHGWRLAALSVRGLRGEPSPVRRSRLLRPGEPVSVVTAVGEDLRVADGEIVGMSLTRERCPYERHFEIETSVAAGPANAGAGVFDAGGNVIGIAVARTTDNRIIAAPADHLDVAGPKYEVRGLLGNGLFSDAIHALRPMVQRPDGADDPELWCMLAVCGEGLGRADERRAALKRACTLDDHNAWAAHALGLALLSPPAERGQALAELRRAVRLEPWNDRYRRSLEDAQR